MNSSATVWFFFLLYFQKEIIYDNIYSHSNVSSLPGMTTVFNYNSFIALYFLWILVITIGCLLLSSTYIMFRLGLNILDWFLMIIFNLLFYFILFYTMAYSLTVQCSVNNTVSTVLGIRYSWKYLDFFYFDHLSTTAYPNHRSWGHYTFFCLRLSNLFSALSSSPFFSLCAKGTLSVSVLLLAFLLLSPFWHIVFCAIYSSVTASGLF